jgi:hypothetical protein
MSLAVQTSPTTRVDELAVEHRLAELAPRPQEIGSTGLDERLLADLAAKHLYTAGTLTHAQLTERLGLSGPIVEKVLQFMRREAKVEVKPRLEGGGSLPYALTERGRTAALDALMRSGYIGTAPVPLADYVAMVKAQSVHARKFERAAVTKAFDGMYMPQTAADQFGISINSGRPVFIYGPAGTGKTYVTHRMATLFRDVVLIPRAIAVDETVVQLFDPLLHKAVGIGERQNIMLEQGHDARYVACERPVIITGGELTLDLLDVRYEPSTRQYEAPLQQKANNGMFVIDDFGRQTMTPAQLLNRWIVPLDRRIDYLSLNTGVKFEIPFAVKVVFSTNLDPSALGDEAFFRRIQSKVFIGPITDDAFDEILRRVAAAQGIACTSDDAAYLRKLTRNQGDGDLRPYVPVMVCEILKSICSYDGSPLECSRTNLDRVAEIYFTRLTDEPMAPRAFAGADASPAGEEVAVGVLGDGAADRDPFVVNRVDGFAVLREDHLPDAGEIGERVGDLGEGEHLLLGRYGGELG